MKKLLLPLLLLTAFTGCKKLCDEWHEGNFCKDEVRERYYGTYNGYNSAMGNFSINVTGGPSERDLNLDGIEARLTSKTDFTVNSQYVFYGGTYATISGYGNFSGNTLHQYLTVNSTAFYIQASR